MGGAAGSCVRALTENDSAELEPKSRVARVRGASGDLLQFPNRINFSARNRNESLIEKLKNRVGHVTTGTLFRNITPGDTVGPWVSQFFWQPCPFGANYVDQRLRTRR